MPWCVGVRISMYTLERHEHSRESPTDSNQDDQETGAPLLSGMAKRTGTVQKRRFRGIEHIQNSFSTVRMPEQWNRLPREFVEIPSLETFQSPLIWSWSIYFWGQMDHVTSRSFFQPQLRFYEWKCLQDP